MHAVVRARLGCSSEENNKGLDLWKPTKLVVYDDSKSVCPLDCNSIARYATVSEDKVAI